MKTTPTLTLLRDVEAALRVLLPFELVQGDTIHRTSPASQQVCNSNIAWAVSNGERSAHKIRTALLALNDALPSIQELVRRAGEVDVEISDELIEKTAHEVMDIVDQAVVRPKKITGILVVTKVLEAIRPHLAPVASGWMPIDSAPRDGIHYLGMIIGDRFYGEPFVCYYDEDEGHICLHQTEARLHHPTHWQHFPAPTIHNHLRRIDI